MLRHADVTMSNFHNVWLHRCNVIDIYGEYVCICMYMCNGQ